MDCELIKECLNPQTQFIPAAIAFAGSIVVALFAFFGVRSQMKANKGISQSTLKEKWITLLRDSISEYCQSVLMFQYRREVTNPEDFEHSPESVLTKEKILKLRFKIQLLLSTRRESHIKLNELMKGKSIAISSEVKKLDQILEATKQILDESWQEVQNLE